MARQTKWDKIKAALLAGEPVTAIARKYGVSIAEILKRANEEGWRREPDPRPKATVTTLPVPIAQAAPPPKPDLVAQAQDDIVREHRELTRTQRDTYMKLQTEFQAMMGHLISFLDPMAIGQIQGAATPSDRIRLLSDLLKATAVKFTMFERLNGMLQGIIELERMAWSLDTRDESTDSTADWEELLARVRAPATVMKLPAEVFAFERRLENAEARTKGGPDDSAAG